MAAICERDCQRCELEERCGGCSYCEAAVCLRKCAECYALCFRRLNNDTYINECLGRPGIHLKKNHEIMVPYHIPVLPDKLIKQPVKFSLVGVHGQNALARNGGKINRAYLEKGFAGVLNISKDTEGIMEFYVRDRTLEGFWDNRKSIIRDLHRLHLAAVIAPNFSVYEDAPRLDHIYNIKRSTVIYNEMLDAGVNAIPDVSWFNINDLEEWIKEINQQGIRLIAFSFQVVDVQLKTSNEWRNSLSGFRYLCQNIPKNVKIIIAGLVSPLRVFEIIKATSGQSIHVLNQSAYVQSRNGIMSATRTRVADKDYCDLFRDNILYSNQLYHELNSISHTKDNLFKTILAWDISTVRGFCTDYVDGDLERVERKYGVAPNKTDLVFSIVKRRIRRKSLKG